MNGFFFLIENIHVHTEELYSHNSSVYAARPASVTCFASVNLNYIYKYQNDLTIKDQIISDQTGYSRFFFKQKLNSL